MKSTNRTQRKEDSSGFRDVFLDGPIMSYIQDFCQGGANLEYVKKRGGEAVRSCRAAAGGGGFKGGRE